MFLKPLAQKVEIRSAHELLQNQMNNRASVQRIRTTLGWQGQHETFTVYWHPDLNMWHYYDSKFAGNRYWCVYGIDEPSEEKMVPITAEINFNYDGYNRRIAGIFISDDDKNIYLAHTGKIGGGRKGIGKNAFLNFYRGSKTVEVEWPDKLNKEVICIGKLGGKALPEQIAHFVKEVARFKTYVTSEQSEVPEIFVPLSDPSFDPEFSGKRKGYAHQGIVESNCNHGIVVSALNKILESENLRTANDRSRDLCVYGDNKKMTILFEIKTDIAISSIYSSIGQLMYHSASQNPPPKVVLVVPGVPNSKTKRILSKLRIEVLEYYFDNNKPEFPNIKEVVR